MGNLQCYSQGKLPKGIEVNFAVQLLACNKIDSNSVIPLYLGQARSMDL